ncbi:MAG: RnfABCDGE type electron transport complex subunit D [Erysipelotrichaceae bacterium]|nr:RnfABCDGE type electron transport complex subunit D [Erysipelotrichaceae bacterium]
MKFTFRTSPNYRQPQSTKQIMKELAFGLLIVACFSVYFNYTVHGSAYGIKVIMMLLTSCIVAIVTEVAWAIMMKKNIKQHISGSFPLITAVIFAMTCPIGTPLYVIGVGSFFAIFFGKLIFGGFGSNIFNPAGIGRAVVFAAFSGKTVPYLTDAAGGILTGSGIINDAITTVTPTTYMASQLGWVVEQEVLGTRLLEQFGGMWNMLLGFYQGAIGETFSLAIIAVGIFLAIRKVIDWRIPVFYVGTVFVLTTIIGFSHGTGLWYPVFSILTGGLLFGAVFMATDPVTNPTHPAGRVLYAVGCGILTVLIRVKANLPEGVLYSILIMNMVSPLIDSVMSGSVIKNLKKNVMIVATTFVVGTVVVGLVGSQVTAKDPRVFVNGDTTEILQWRANIIGAEQVGNDIKYTVWTDGAQSSSNKEKEANVFAVYVNEDTMSISKMEVISLGDTPGIAEMVMDPEYLAQFEGIALDNFSKIEVLDDVVSGATGTVRSTVRAAREVVNLYMNESEVIYEDEDVIKVRVVYNGYYMAYDLKHEGNESAIPNIAVFTFDATTHALIGWEVEQWGDSKGIDSYAENAIVGPYIEKGATLENVFMNDAVSGATFSQTTTSTAVKSAMLEIANRK